MKEIPKEAKKMKAIFDNHHSEKGRKTENPF